MKHIIVARNPRDGGGILVITDDQDNPSIFDSYDHAMECVRAMPLLQAWQYQIVELEI